MRLEFLGNADAGIGDCDFCDTPAVPFTRLLAEGTGDRPALGGILIALLKIFNTISDIYVVSM